MVSPREDSVIKRILSKSSLSRRDLLKILIISPLINKIYFSDFSIASSRSACYVPLDNRPPNFIYPKRLADILGIKLLIPPEDMLSERRKKASSQKILAFLVENWADCAIISADSMIFGGLVPSRETQMTQDDAIWYTKRLLSLKSSNIFDKVYLFKSLMRLMPTVLDEKELFYATKIEEIMKFSDEDIKNPVNFYERELLLTYVPPDILKDYITSRKINYFVDRMLIKNSEKVDLLVLAQDDSADRGIAYEEKKRLSMIATKNTKIVQGSDEIGMILVTRFGKNKDISLKTIFIPEDIEEEVMPLETVALGKNLLSQINLLNLKLKINEPDFYMVVFGKDEDKRTAFEKVKYLVNNKKNVAFADVSNMNMTDKNMFKLLLTSGLIFRLIAYAGWNTAANTTGCALSQAVSYLSGRNFKENFRFLIERIIYDYYYQNVIRPQINNILIQNNQSNFKMTEESIEIAKNIFFQYFPGISEEIRIFSPIKFDITDVRFSLPWARTFEANIEIDIKLI
ncbi:Protein of unknown function (DUF4127) [Thermodesulfobium acidiphilum]|uniref:DUF4127 family protein n=1 Tax=Thermodesulfobium acidiphilum TaxID=1794699 RepID=A0A2R4VYA8_THEAF|nr:DUF4127 family protein [Thermodesulfobium acidiphilum]AWB09505.1 Protein of unknown function (DUF4127) [Thermodesulfobium acidiphilum]